MRVPRASGSPRRLWAQIRALAHGDDEVTDAVEADGFGARLLDILAAAPAAALEIGFALGDPAAFDDAPPDERAPTPP